MREGGREGGRKGGKREGVKEGGREGGKREEGTLVHIYIDHTCAVITNSYTHNVRDGADHSVSTMTFNIQI